MKKAHHILLSVTTLLLLTGAGRPSLTKPQVTINWMSFEEAANLNEKDKKKVFIDVYTDWCGWCKVMDKKTFSDARIAEYVNKRYYAVKLNAESKKPVTYKGKTISEAELAQRVFQATSFPTTVYLNEDLDMISPVAGYLEVDILGKILRYYGEDAYKNKSWEDFQASYKN